MNMKFFAQGRFNRLSLLASAERTEKAHKTYHSILVVWGSTLEEPYDLQL